MKVPLFSKGSSTKSKSVETKSHLSAASAKQKVACPSEKSDKSTNKSTFPKLIDSYLRMGEGYRWFILAQQVVDFQEKQFGC
jgi:hypothetical protein